MMVSDRTGQQAARQQATKRVVIRSVALPSEHGGWGFLIEPILLGLLVAFSWQGVLLAIAAVGVFLIHQPLKIATKDRLNERQTPRLLWAQRFVLGYAALAVVPMLVLLLSTPLLFLLPIVLAIPFAAVQLYYDARNRSRQLLPEVAGAAALAMIAPAIAILGGWTFGMAIVLWAILAMRAVAAILYVRCRIRLKLAKPTSPISAWVAHGLALVGMAGLILAGVTPWLGIVPFVVLFIRAYLGLSRFRKDHPIQVIGILELCYGLMTVLFVSVGYGLG